MIVIYVIYAIAEDVISYLREDINIAQKHFIHNDKLDKIMIEKL